MNELQIKAKELRELKRMQEELAAEITAIEGEIMLCPKTCRLSSIPYGRFIGRTPQQRMIRPLPQECSRSWKTSCAPLATP